MADNREAPSVEVRRGHFSENNACFFPVQPYFFTRPKEPMKKSHAFTLIELLVVISIIAILASFALPVFNRAMEKGRAKDCANNLRNVGQGIILYMNDNDGTMFSESATGDDAWPNLLRIKYIKDWNTFRSPFDKVTSARPKVQLPPFPVSYGINSNLFDTFEGKWKNAGSALILAAPAIDVSVTGREVRFMASAMSNNNVKVVPSGGGAAGGTGASGTGANQQSQDGTTGGRGTHQLRGALNVLFADGHVDEMDWFKYSDNTSELGKQRWDPAYEPGGTTP
jgi:prepilin-type N-terminal cleavage/methylation domain-containing protein/prepilin-type processing-associated H-X9-DG protein